MKTVTDQELEKLLRDADEVNAETVLQEESVRLQIQVMQLRLLAEIRDRIRREQVW
jgi:hypothetical protein